VPDAEGSASEKSDQDKGLSESLFQQLLHSSGLPCCWPVLHKCSFPNMCNPHVTHLCDSEHLHSNAAATPAILVWCLDEAGLPASVGSQINAGCGGDPGSYSWTHIFLILAIRQKSHIDTVPTGVTSNVPSCLRPPSPPPPSQSLMLVVALT
jgi:hypothetical protein